MNTEEYDITTGEIRHSISINGIHHNNKATSVNLKMQDNFVEFFKKKFFEMFGENYGCLISYEKEVALMRVCTQFYFKRILVADYINWYVDEFWKKSNSNIPLCLDGALRQTPVQTFISLMQEQRINNEKQKEERRIKKISALIEQHKTKKTKNQ